MRAVHSAIVAFTVTVLQSVSPGAAEEVGGDDVILDPVYELPSDLVIAPDGTIFVVKADDDYALHILRSIDGGTTFDEWASLAGGTTRYGHAAIIAGTAIPHLYVVYGFPSPPQEVRLLKVPLSDPGQLTVTTVMSDPDPSALLSNPMIIADDLHYPDDHYLYVVAERQVGLDPKEIVFTRSTDQGTSWPAAYPIANGSSAFYGYVFPRLALTVGGWIHCIYTEDDAASGQTLYHQRTPAYASGGAVAWTAPAPLGVPELVGLPDITASPLTAQLLLSFNHETNGQGNVEGLLRVSLDEGETWPAPSGIAPDHATVSVAVDPATATYVLVGKLDVIGVPSELRLFASTIADPTNWTDVGTFRDPGGPQTSYGSLSQLAPDPSRNGAMGIVWREGNGVEFELRFDAMWRADPGYPNLQDGFPVALSAPPISPPALMPLNGGGQENVVFGDAAGYVQAYLPDGSSRDGWPVFVGDMPLDRPIAISDLDGDALPETVVGTTDGRLVIIARDGQILYNVLLVADPRPVFVSLGFISAPNRSDIVACVGSMAFVLTWDGSEVSLRENALLPGDALFQAAIGDLDEDGVTEYVIATFNEIVIRRFGLEDPLLTIPIPQVPSEAPALADFDQDGDLEIVVPTEGGLLHVLHHNGPIVDGFPQYLGFGDPLTGVALSSIAPDIRPEIAVTDAAGRLFLLNNDGSMRPGYPLLIDGGVPAAGGPVVSTINRDGSDIVTVSANGLAGAYSTEGLLLDGWPKDIDAPVPVMGAAWDVEDDNRNEYVFLTDTELYMYDVNHYYQWHPGRRWPMYGYNPQRTSCLDCPNSVVDVEEPDVTPAVPEAMALTLRSPNPSTRGALLAFGLDRAEDVRVDVFDVAGRRVRSLAGGRYAAGLHHVRWDGRDATGRQVGAGTYFVRSVIGNGRTSETVRVVVVR